MFFNDGVPLYRAETKSKWLIICDERHMFNVSLKTLYCYLVNKIKEFLMVLFLAHFYSVIFIFIFSLGHCPILDPDWLAGVASSEVKLCACKEFQVNSDVQIE